MQISEARCHQKAVLILSFFSMRAQIITLVTSGGITILLQWLYGYCLAVMVPESLAMPGHNLAIVRLLAEWLLLSCMNCQN